jgi:DNA-binding XRE family transcriptional regulator
VYETPDPIPSGYLRSLIEGAGITQGEAARLVHVLPQTMRRWLTDGYSHRDPPWAAVELLRIKIAKKKRSPTS